jgi:hypothetical protein
MIKSLNRLCIKIDYYVASLKAIIGFRWHERIIGQRRGHIKIKIWVFLKEKCQVDYPALMSCACNVNALPHQTC